MWIRKTTIPKSSLCHLIAVAGDTVEADRERARLELNLHW